MADSILTLNMVQVSCNVLLDLQKKIDDMYMLSRLNPSKVTFCPTGKSSDTQMENWNAYAVVASV